MSPAIKIIFFKPSFKNEEQNLYENDRLIRKFRTLCIPRFGGFINQLFLQNNCRENKST